MLVPKDFKWVMATNVQEGDVAIWSIAWPSGFNKKYRSLTMGEMACDHNLLQLKARIESVQKETIQNLRIWRRIPNRTLLIQDCLEDKIITGLELG